MTVTFETKCWEGDWERLLKTPYLEEQIARNDFAFDQRVLFINNVRDPKEVSHYARRLVASGLLTGYHLVDTHAREALEFFGLSREALGQGYVYSIAELVGIYLCRTPFLLHFSGDSILERRHAWVGEAVQALEYVRDAVVANPIWNGCFSELRSDAIGQQGDFCLGRGFSDQCYLIRVADFRARIYAESNPASERYPAHGGNSFEKRVDAWMRNHGRTRLTHARISYRHLQGFRQIPANDPLHSILRLHENGSTAAVSQAASSALPAAGRDETSGQSESATSPVLREGQIHVSTNGANDQGGLLSVVPKSAWRILHLGCGRGDLGAAIKAR